MKKIKQMKKTRIIGLLMVLLISMPTILMINTEEDNSVRAEDIPYPAWPIFYGISYSFPPLEFLIGAWHTGDVLATLGSPPWLYYFCLHGCINKGLDPQTDEFWECVKNCQDKYYSGTGEGSDCGC